MNFEPVGYAHNGALYCPDCAQKLANRLGVDLDNADECEEHEISAHFDHHETDYPQSCGTCHTFIPSAILDSGVKSILEWAREEIRRGTRTEYVAECVDHIQYYVQLTAFQRGILRKHATLPFRPSESVA